MKVCIFVFKEFFKLVKNKEIIKLLELTAQLLELHDENQFKIKSFQYAAQVLEYQTHISLCALSEQQILEINGIGKKIASSIVEICTNGSFQELELLLEKTPSGVFEMLSLKGVGPKKVRFLWKEKQIDSIHELLKKCNDNEVANFKGFGAKTQAKIADSIEFKLSNEGKYLYAEVIQIATELIDYLSSTFSAHKIEFVGAIAMQNEIVEVISFITTSPFSSADLIFPEFQNVVINSENNSFKGVYSGVKVEIYYVNEQDYYYKKWLLSSTKQHIEIIHNKVNSDSDLSNSTSDHDIYKRANFYYIKPAFRVGNWEFKSNSFDKIIETKQLLGCLHNHSNYSDGLNTLNEMSEQCVSLGFQYFGISDHSKSAFYANGLGEERIKIQHKEIDSLNAQFTNFKIFKGIESDILNDGSLDYGDAVLKSFDFIVASIHSNLSMDEEKATQRLIKAIENPFTTILGHPTGRLLLRRSGYKINHKKIIDACAVNKVVIELNSNPWRLDLDWRWIQYCIEKDVLVSINPDAHNLEGLSDMHFGVLVAQKGGLTTEMCFNSKSLKEMEAYLQNIKKIKLGV